MQTAVVEETVVEDATVKEQVAQELIIKGRDIKFIAAGPYNGFLQGSLQNCFIYWFIYAEKLNFLQDFVWHLQWSLSTAQYPYPVRVPASIAEVREDGSFIRQTYFPVPIRPNQEQEAKVPAKRATTYSTTSSPGDTTSINETATKATKRTHHINAIGKNSSYSSQPSGHRMSPQSLSDGLRKIRMIFDKCPKCLGVWQ